MEKTILIYKKMGIIITLYVIVLYLQIRISGYLNISLGSGSLERQKGEGWRFLIRSSPINYYRVLYIHLRCVWLRIGATAADTHMGGFTVFWLNGGVWSTYVSYSEEVNVVVSWFLVMRGRGWSKDMVYGYINLIKFGWVFDSFFLPL